MSQFFTCIRPKYWSFIFSISPSNEYSGLISFRMHWLNLLAVQGTLKRLLQPHSSKASVLLQCSSVAQSCPTLCDPMDCSMPGLPVHHQLPEFTQTHLHWVSDAIQPSHPLSSPSPQFFLEEFKVRTPVSLGTLSHGEQWSESLITI